ncbi:MAG: hypothetical protein KY455_02470 [Euryarchaeota archaeon]|nr:hypothetical protein [Euryarchaeota archaeon]
MDTYLHGVGHTPFGRHTARLDTLAIEAFERMHGEAEEALPEPGHVVVSSQFPGEYGGVENAAAAVTDGLGLAGLAATRVESGPSSGLAALEIADALIRSGARDTVLVVGVETMTRLPAAMANQVLARMATLEERKLGLTMAAQVALMTRAYLEEHGIERELLADCAVKAHAHGLQNPLAQFRKAVTRDEVLASGPVADPLRLYDCAPLSDGAVCLLVSREKGPLRLGAMGHATDHLSITHRNHDARTLTSFRATTRAAEEAFGRSGWSVEDIDLIETHDAFSLLEGMNLEDLGLFERGAGVRTVAEGETAVTGKHPTNVGGGLKARGHPVGATGCAQVAELFWQLTGHAEVEARSVERAQGKRPKKALAHNIGGLGNNIHVALLEATA